LIAAISGEELSGSNKADDLLNHLRTIAMTNTAGLSAIVDTKGGTPKADHKKFPVLGKLFPKMSKFGGFAAHKMKDDLDSLVKEAEKKLQPADIVSEVKQEAKEAEKPKTDLDILRQGYKKGDNKDLAAVLTKLKNEFENNPNAAANLAKWLSGDEKQTTPFIQGVKWEVGQNRGAKIEVNAALFKIAIDCANGTLLATGPDLENSKVLVNTLLSYQLSHLANIAGVKEENKEAAAVKEEKPIETIDSLDEEYESLYGPSDDMTGELDESKVEIHILGEQESTIGIFRAFSAFKDVKPKPEVRPETEIKLSEESKKEATLPTNQHETSKKQPEEEKKGEGEGEGEGDPNKPGGHP
jgi:hypothetical protein